MTINVKLKPKYIWYNDKTAVKSVTGCKRGKNSREISKLVLALHLIGPKDSILTVIG